MQPRNLLIIDDEPAIARLIARAGRSTGYEVVSTSEHEEFRRSYAIYRPEVISIDLAMPGMDGIELLRFLAESDCDSQIVIVSGFDRRILDTAFDLGQALGLNVVAKLSKPVRMNELRSLLTELASGA